MTQHTPKRAYVETYGCQMNIADGELMEGILEAKGYVIADRPEEAVTYYRAASELSARIPFITAFLGMALATVGDLDEAEAIAADIERKAERGTSVATCLGALLIRLGRVDDGLRWLERAIEAREPMALVVDTHFLPLPEVREHPRFERILEQAPKPSMMGRRP